MQGHGLKQVAKVDMMVELHSEAVSEQDVHEEVVEPKRWVH